MTTTHQRGATAVPEEVSAIRAIFVAGYKSISQPTEIEVRPLTLLAGANSSGKSSIMQPLLLLKQTLEASYDPGALRLDGPNVRFTSAEQFLSHVGRGKHTDVFSVGIDTGSEGSLTTHFKKQPGKPIEVQRNTFIRGNNKKELRVDMTLDEIKSNLGPFFLQFITDDVGEEPE